MADKNLKHKNSEEAKPLAPKLPRIQDTEDINEKESANGGASFTDLPNEILGKITDLLSFDDLFNLKRVSKRMQEIALNVAWPRRNTLDENSINYGINLDDEEEESEINDKKIKLILSRANIKYLDLSIISIYSDDVTHQICFQLHLASKLIKLNLTFIDLKKDSFEVIGNSCPLIEEANFWGCFNDKNIDDGLEFFFKKCQNLKRLELSDNNIIGKCFAYIPTKLRYLNLGNSSDITSHSMELLSLRAKNLETLIHQSFKPTTDVNIWLKKLTKLRFLNLSWLQENLPYLDFSRLQGLEMLCLFGNNLVTAETLKSLKNCQKLKGLDLRYNGRLDSSAIIALKSCNMLKYCDFSGLKNLADLVDLIETCKVEYLAINDCDEIQPQVLKSIITDCNSISHLEICGEDYNKTLSTALSEKCIHRSKILKLYVMKRNKPLPSCDWCEVTSSCWPSGFPTHECIKIAIEKNTPYISERSISRNP